MIEKISLIIISIFSAFILYKSSDILKNTERNAWDILYLNSVLAILTLFFIGLIANNFDVWKFVVGALSIVAAGERLSSALQSKKVSKQEENTIKP